MIVVEANHVHVRYNEAKRRQIEFDVGDYVWKKAYPPTDGTKYSSGHYKISIRARKNVYELVDNNDVIGA
jgi:hypothetical protein